MSCRPPIPILLKRALRRRCPRCGRDGLFERWHQVKPVCGHCGLPLQEREGDCWAFMYGTTAFFTGLFVVAILLYRPPDLLLGRVVLFAAGLTVLVGSLPFRKSIALALDYLANPPGDDRTS